MAESDDKRPLELSPRELALLELLLHFIRRMYQERPLFFLVVEHNMEFVMALAAEIVVMHQGAVLERGTPEAIQASPRVMDAYLG